MLQYHFNWKTLSAMAGVTWWNFYFRLFPGAIRSPQIIEFLTHLLRHIPGKLLIVWVVCRAIAAARCGSSCVSREDACGWSFFPAYRSELNPVVSTLWSHWKQHELPNLCPKTLGELESLCPKGAASWICGSDALWWPCSFCSR